MDVQSIKLDLIHWLTELKYFAVIKEVQKLKEIHFSEYELSIEQETELKERLEKYEAGEMKFSSWETAKERIRNKAKDA